MLGALAFSSGIFFSPVPLSFSHPAITPWMETRLSRLSGDRQYGPDNGPQSGGCGGEERRGREREREGKKEG